MDEMIVFSEPIEIVKVPEVRMILNSINRIEFRDYPESRLVEAKVVDPHIGVITLWEGDAYDSIGDWTEDQALSRLKEILTTTMKAINYEAAPEQPGFFRQIANAFKSLV